MQQSWLPKQWERIVKQASLNRPNPIPMVEFRQKFHSYSQPAVLMDADGQEYVVKALQHGHNDIHRSIVAEQIVCHLGKFLGMPVGQPVLVDIPQTLIDMNPDLKTPYLYRSGVAHGSIRIPNCSDRIQFGQYNTPENRPRYASLAVLYGLAGCFCDWQVIASTQPPNTIYSVDHGHFFKDGPMWTVDSLRETPLAQIDPTVRQLCGLNEQEIVAAKCCLHSLQNKHIAQAVAMPPDEWR